MHIILLKCPHVQIAFLKFTSCDNQALFSRVYSNCCCSCSFEAEIIKIDQSSHKMCSNNILNFLESTTILNACIKKSGNLLKALHMWHVKGIFQSISNTKQQMQNEKIKFISEKQVTHFIVDVKWYFQVDQGKFHSLTNCWYLLLFL